MIAKLLRGDGRDLPLEKNDHGNEPVLLRKISAGSIDRSLRHVVPLGKLLGKPEIHDLEETHRRNQFVHVPLSHAMLPEL